MLHSLLPHKHHDEMNAYEHELAHQEATSLLDYIKLVFHEDMGEGHLEHVVVSQHLSIDLNPSYLVHFGPFIGADTGFTFGRKNFALSYEDFVFKEPLRSSHICSNIGLRAPPSLM